MPEAINGIEIFAGDLNKAQTGMEKIENVYHIKGLKIKEIIKQNRNISDHPIILAEINCDVELKNNKDTITILDKNIKKRKMEILEREIQLNDGANFEFENPQISKTINVQKYFDDLANLIQIKSKNGHWKPENENDFKNILQGFKELYNDIGEKNINKENICTVMLKIINIIKQVYYDFVLLFPLF